jgi:Tfp pilus assembly protein PilF
MLRQWLWMFIPLLLIGVLSGCGTPGGDAPDTPAPAEDTPTSTDDAYPAVEPTAPDAYPAAEPTPTEIYPAPGGAAPVPDDALASAYPLPETDDVPATAAELYNEGQAAEALRLLGAALAEEPTAELYNARGRLLIELRRFSEAETDFTTALELEPENLESRLGRGISFARRVLTEQALSDLDAVIAADPQNAEALTVRSVVYRQSDQFDLALEDANAAIEADPEYAPAYEARARLHLRADETDAAIADYERAIELDPGAVDVTYDYGMLLLGMGDPEGALAQFQAVAENATPGPDSATLQRANAQLQLLTGDREADDSSDDENDTSGE